MKMVNLKKSTLPSISVTISYTDGAVKCLDGCNSIDINETVIICKMPTLECIVPLANCKEITIE